MSGKNFKNRLALLYYIIIGENKAMTNEDLSKINQPQHKNSALKKHFKLSWQISVVAILFIAILGYILIFALNNCSIWSDKKFSEKLDEAIKQAANWVHYNEAEILRVKNIALIKMLQDCNSLYPQGKFAVICNKFMAAPAWPACWKALIDPNYPVQKWELNQAIKKEYIDNKWILYAIAPDKADITPEQMQLFSPDKWNGRQLTHQLWGLVHLRKTRPEFENEKLIEHLCNRITRQLTFNAAIVDIYIQKISFVLYAGHPEKIRRRWVERVIANQQPSGGWNDRWLCFESRRRPVFSLVPPPSNQHATVQALWLLYQVKYRYPHEFGLN
jgi:hypothetical protein